MYKLESVVKYNFNCFFWYTVLYWFTCWPETWSISHWAHIEPIFMSNHNSLTATLPAASTFSYVLYFLSCTACMGCQNVRACRLAFGCFLVCSSATFFVSACYLRSVWYVSALGKEISHCYRISAGNSPKFHRTFPVTDLLIVCGTIWHVIDLNVWTLSQIPACYSQSSPICAVKREHG